MGFDYEASTRDAYKDGGVAREYHGEFNGPVTWRTLRAHFIARRELRVVGRLLGRIEAATVLDIPCGTGKLAPVVAGKGCQVVAADVSPDMLQIGKETYLRHLPAEKARFRVADVENLRRDLGEDRVDAVLCLRLMHRVPADIRARMLSEIAATAPFAIVSFGLKSTYHRIRKALRSAIFRVENKPLCLATAAELRSELTPRFEILAEARVSPLASEEIVFLLRSRVHGN
jgi:2-polyprenyl-3-methyl-5-hydroxy-6-metoxy-1,4-benzoquinol methylase